MKYDTKRSLLTNLLVNKMECPQDIPEFPMETRTMLNSKGVARDIYLLNDGSTVMMQIKLRSLTIEIVHNPYVNYDRAIEAIASGVKPKKVLGNTKWTYKKDNENPSKYFREGLERLSKLCGGEFKANQH